MTPETSQTTTFDAVRSRLFGLAYRMLGARADAEDVVQDTFVRWHGTDQAAVQNPEAWLVTIATRLAVDRLRRLKTERAAYTGPWLPEPILDEPPPDRHLELASDLSMAMLTLLETLAPDERAAFLLHDVFDMQYDRIASVLGKSEAACRQTIHRARERVRGPRRRFASTPSDKAALLERFKAGVEAADEAALIQIFAPDVVWTTDGGGRTAAAPAPLHGVDRIVRLILGLRRKHWRHRVFETTVVNGEPGLVIRQDGRVTAVMAFDVADGRIAAVFNVLNPDKLPH